MPADPPILDGRDQADLIAQTRALATAYTDGEWTPGQDDPGDAIVALFGELASDLVERLDQRPYRHRVGFVDSLGFERLPPTAARLPVTVTVANGVETVTVPEETAVLAPGTDGSERTFVTVDGSAFEATSAVLDRVYAVDPSTDHIVDHRDLIKGTATATLFDGENQQRHALYLGDETLLAVSPGGSLRVAVSGPTAGHVLESALRWEYHGEDSTGRIDWHPMAVHPAPVDPTAERDDTATISLSVPGTMTPTTVGENESLFVRARVPAGLGPLGLFDIRIDSVAVGPGPLDRPPILMLAGDVPQESGPIPDDETEPTDSEEPTAVLVLPFGETPRHRDEFYIADDEVFSKADADVALMFHRTSTSEQSTGTIPRLSWEYWDGGRWARLAVTDGTEGFTIEGEVRFTVPTDLMPTTVAGELSRWIRVRLVGGSYIDVEYVLSSTEPGELSEVRTGEIPTFSAVGIDYMGDLPEELPTHRLVENGLAVVDVADTLDGQKRFAPFIPVPDTEQTLYFGFDRPLSGGPFTILWDVSERTQPPGFEPSLRWEYGIEPDDGKIWRRAPATDGTEGIRHTGVVALEIPEATAPRKLFGAERHWLRVRVSGDRFETGVRPASAGDLSVRVVAIDAQTERVVLRNDGDRAVDLTGFMMDFEHDQPADQRWTLPMGTSVGPGEHLVVETGAEPPAEPAADVRFSFTRAVINSVDPDTIALVTPGDDPVHALTDVAPEWRVPLLDLDDDLTDLTRVDLRLPFVSDDEATVADIELMDEESDTDAAEGPPPCDPSLPTAPPAGAPSRAAPRLKGLYRNAAWAADVRCIRGERVGSSNGGANQQFTLRQSPALDVTVTVDEASALSAAAREELLAESPDDVRVELDSDGEVRRVFVAWTRVPDLLSSRPTDRHYVLDALTGVVRFGDGTHGRNPPRSRDGIRANYVTGGGRAGNIPANSVSGLKSSLPFIDEVTNPLAADGGTEAEPTAAVLARAPAELRNRNRGVTVADVERLAAATSRQLARIRCLPRLDAAGERRSGWVTLVLVPDVDVVRPRPSATLCETVTQAMRDRLPVSVVAGDRLVVRGPSYVTASVSVTVVGDGGLTIGALEAAVADVLGTFLHPLTGGPSGDGWAFGRLPAPGDFFAKLEDLDGVDHVADLTIRFESNKTSVTVGAGDTPPAVAEDVLVASGNHTVTATGGAR